MKKPLSPLKSIRKNCLDCCLGQAIEVRLCGAILCPSSSLRFGNKVEGLNVLKTIKEHCIHCGGNEEAPKNCIATVCALFPFRLVKNPNRAGIGNPSSLKQCVKGQKTPTESTEKEQTTTQTGQWSGEASCTTDAHSSREDLCSC